MPGPPYRALCIFVRAFSLLAALGGLRVIFAEKPHDHAEQAVRAFLLNSIPCKTVLGPLTLRCG